MAPRLTLLVLTSLLFRGCASSRSQPAPSSLFAGLNLDQPVRALGTEPFWAVDVQGDELVYSGVNRPEQRARVGRVISAGEVVFRGTTASGVVLTVTLMPSACSDGMSDRVYPFVARVQVGGEHLSGCAGSVAAIMSAGESGPVVE